MSDDHDDLSIAGFEWDQTKSDQNLAKHGLDFDQASEVFYGPVLLKGSDRSVERRWIAIGYASDRLIAVVFTWRAENIRIISARRARKNEERDYRHAEVGRPPKG